jgi:uncharacterized membrane protein
MPPTTEPVPPPPAAENAQSAAVAPPEAAPPAETSVFDIQLNTLPMSAPITWLRLGWRDFTRAPGIGIFYGVCFAGMGWLLLLLFRHAPAYTLALSAGFLLMGPFMCLGLYDASLKIERGEKPDLGDSLMAWDTRIGTMAIFGAVLLVLEMLWARASLVVFALSFDGMPDFKGSLMALLDPENLAFIVAYLAVGGLFAGLIFAVSVVAMPMILHRQTDAITAGLTSLRLCLTQPGLMLFWGALITVLVVLALLPWFLGLLVVAPVLGHASWHAYRAAVQY